MGPDACREYIQFPGGRRAADMQGGVHEEM